MTTAIVTKKMKRCEGSSIYPISKEAIASIAANMKEYGFDRNFPILVKDGGIVDGYHRYEAALDTGVEPVFEEFEGGKDAALAYVLRANGDRRHLNEGQKAAAAIGINRALGKDAESIAKLAKIQGVSEATVNRLTSYSDEDLGHIVSGEKTQNEVKDKARKRTSSQPTTYALSKTQAARMAALAVKLDERGKRLLTQIFNAGLKVLEEQAS